MKKLTDLEWDGLREELAALEHKRWAKWQKYLHSVANANLDGSLKIPSELVQRWERQIRMEYADLSETEKDSDREQVDAYLPIIKRFVGQA